MKKNNHLVNSVLIFASIIFVLFLILTLSSCSRSYYGIHDGMYRSNGVKVGIGRDAAIEWRHSYIILSDTLVTIQEYDKSRVFKIPVITIPPNPRMQIFLSKTGTDVIVLDLKDSSIKMYKT